MYGPLPLRQVHGPASDRVVCRLLSVHAVTYLGGFLSWDHPSGPLAATPPGLLVDLVAVDCSGSFEVGPVAHLDVASWADCRMQPAAGLERRVTRPTVTPVRHVGEAQ